MRYFYNFNFKKLSNVTCIFAAGNAYVFRGNFSISDPACAKNVLTVGGIDDFYVPKDIFNITSINNPDFSFQAPSLDFEDPWINGSDNDLYFLYTQDDAKVKELLNLKSDISVVKNIIIDSKKIIARASYSSTGPAFNGILKPDVIAPGEDIVSVKSKLNSNSPHGCADVKDANFIFMGGTSMACPNVAGGAALVRQYFESGKWNEKVTLDGETTRALIINSCVHPLNSKVTDILYGHGVVDLSTIIPIENDFGVEITNQNHLSTLLDDDSKQKTYLLENSHLVAKLSVDKNLNNKKLQITLSYLDSTISESSPIPIVHDLDLTVESPTKKIFIGDHLANNDTQHTSTNEKVIINEDEIENGEYKIHIYSNEFIDNIDPYKPIKQEFGCWILFM